VSTAPHATEKSARKAGIAGAAGNLIEFYDFSLYGLLAVVISPTFFPNENQAVSTLIALGAFGTSYVARPFGGIFFGRLGDRYGRRPVLMTTVISMGLAAGAIGLLPGYDSIGIAAPVLLILLRLVQGFSAGGELAGATTYVVESSPQGRRSFFAAVVGSGGSLGFVVAAVASGIVGGVLTEEQFSDWGWRLLFLLCVPLAVLCLLVRSRLDESPAFEAAQRREKVTTSPVRAMLRHSWPALLRVIGIQIGCGAAAYMGLVYLSVYLVGTRGFAAADVYWIAALAIGVQVIALPFFGALGGRIGRRKLLFAATATLFVLAYPFFVLLSATESLVVVTLLCCAYLLVQGMQVSVSVTEFTLLFPVEYRYTGSALGYNVATAVAGGFSPFIAAQLILWTGSDLAPAYWLMAVSAISLAVLATLGSFGPDRPSSVDYPDRPSGADNPGRPTILEPPS